MGREGKKYLKINAAFIIINIKKQFTGEHLSASTLKYFLSINPTTKPWDDSRAVNIVTKQ